MKKQFLLIALLCSLFVPQVMAQSNSYVKTGDKAPVFIFEKKPGAKIKSTELKGKVVLVNLFATWCPPCRKELPHVEKDIWAKYKDNSNFEMLTFGREHTWVEINKFVKENNFTFPIYPDPERGVFSQFAKQSIPRSFLIDKDGTVLYQSTGFDEKEFEKLKNLLAKKL